MIRKPITPKQVAQKGFHLLKSIISKAVKTQLKIQVKILLIIFGLHFLDSLVIRDDFRI